MTTRDSTSTALEQQGRYSRALMSLRQVAFDDMPEIPAVDGLIAGAVIGLCYILARIIMHLVQMKWPAQRDVNLCAIPTSTIELIDATHERVVELHRVTTGSDGLIARQAQQTRDIEHIAKHLEKVAEMQHQTAVVIERLLARHPQ